MTKHLRYLFVMLMGLLGVTTGWAQTYKKVTSADEIVAGNKYVVVCESKNVAMKVYSSGTKCDAVNVVITNNTIQHVEDLNVLTLEEDSESPGTYYFKQEDNRYLYSSTAKNLKADDTNMTACTINSDFTINMGNSGDLQYNASSPRFCPYTSTQTKAYLYVLDSDPTKSDVILSFGETTVFTVNIADVDDFVAPTLTTDPAGLTVTYASDNEDVATVNENTGAVTVNDVEGEANITATFAGNDNYNSGTASYKIKVVDPNRPGSETNPYSVAAAIAAIDAGTGITNVYATGKVSSVGSFSSGAISYYISDDGTTESDQLQAYKGKGINGANFTSADDIRVGDVVVIYGNLKKYNTTYEFDSGNYLVSLQRKQVVSIAVSGEYQTEFIEGEAFNHDGVIVTATYDDGTPGDVTANATFSEPDMTQIGDQTVTVTYGEQTATYTITISEAPSYTATFSVNGTTTTADVKEGAAIEFPEDPAAIEGKSFVGWTDTAIDGTTDDEPYFVTSATMGDQDVTFYAVFANVEGTPEALVKMAAGDTFAEGDNVVIVANVNDETAYGLYQETQSNSYVKNYEFDGSYATVVANDKNWWTVSAGTDGKWILGDDTNGYLYSSGSNNLSVDLNNASQWTLEDNGDGTFGLTQGRYLSCRIDLSGANVNLFRLAGSNPNGVFALDIYKMVGGATYSDYCTTVEAAATSESITISAALYATYITTNALDFTGTAVTAFIVDEATTANVHFTPVTIVPAATPIVVKAAAAGTYDIPVTTDDTENVGTNLLLAPEAGQTSTGVEYCLANKSKGIGFYPVSQGVAIKKAYLVISTTGAPEFIGFIEDGGISTGISTVAVENAELNIDAPMYNIAGQRVSRSYKGVVIQNGKKFVVK